jgi:hypothetical protein
MPYFGRPEAKVGKMEAMETYVGNENFISKIKSLII